MYPALQALWDSGGEAFRFGVLRNSHELQYVLMHLLAPADPLCWHGATRVRVANEYLLATEAVLNGMPRYHFPFIVFHGADDTLTDPDGSRALYERSQVFHLCPTTGCLVQLLLL